VRISHGNKRCQTTQSAGRDGPSAKAMHLERQQGAGLDPAAPSYRKAAEAAPGSWQSNLHGRAQLDRVGGSDGTSCRAAMNALQVGTPAACAPAHLPQRVPLSLRRPPMGPSMKPRHEASSWFDGCCALYIFCQTILQVIVEHRWEVAANERLQGAAAELSAATCRLLARHC
jgi:hypothetical protein